MYSREGVASIRDLATVQAFSRFCLRSFRSNWPNTMWESVCVCGGGGGGGGGGRGFGEAGISPLMLIFLVTQ